MIRSLIALFLLSLLFHFKDGMAGEKSPLIPDACSETLAPQKLNYAGISFEVPVLSSTGFLLRNKPADLDPTVLQQAELQAISEVWNFNRLIENHRPIRIGSIEDREKFETPGVPSVLDMPIKFPGTDYLIPDNFLPIKEGLQKIIDFEHAANPLAQKNYYAYLTVHHSWVEEGNYQRRPGFHVDGFQGVERPIKEPIEHSYFIFNSVPTVFTKQKFQFWNFDFGRFNVFSELDRQAISEDEFEGEPFQIYYANAYNIHRANVARKRVLRTFVRITYSVAIFDRLGLSDNPLFPYLWERKEKWFQSTLEKYTPPLGVDKLANLGSLKTIAKKRAIVVGVGEGSDALQAGQIAKLLQSEGVEIAFLASFRKKQNFIGGTRVEENVILVDTDFRMQSRLFEDRLSNDFETYMFFDEEDSERTVQVLNRLAMKHHADSMVLVDGGGNILSSPSMIESAKLNDHRTLEIAAMSPLPKSIVIVSPGVDMPQNAHEILERVEAKRYRPSRSQRELLLDQYKKWGMSLESPHTFAFVPMIWQQALAGDFGPQRFPTLYPGDPAYVVTPESQDILVVPFANALRNYRDQIHTLKMPHQYIEKQLGNELLRNLRFGTPVEIHLGRVPEALSEISKMGFQLGEEIAKEEGFHRIYWISKPSGQKRIAVIRVNTPERLVHLESALKMAGAKPTVLGEFSSWKINWKIQFSKMNNPPKLVVFGMPNSALDAVLKDEYPDLEKQIKSLYEIRRKRVGIQDHELSNMEVAVLSTKTGDAIWFVPNLYGKMAKDFFEAVQETWDIPRIFLGSSGALNSSLRVGDWVLPEGSRNSASLLGLNIKSARAGKVPSFLIETKQWLQEAKKTWDVVDVESQYAMDLAPLSQSAFYSFLVITDNLSGPNAQDISQWSYRDQVLTVPHIKNFIYRVLNRESLDANRFVSLTSFSLSGME